MFHERYWIRQTRAAQQFPGWSDDESAPLSSLPASWQCDLATDELRWSNGVFDLFGIDRGSTVDRRATLELYTAESRKTLNRLRAAALETCGSFTFEAQIRRHDGNYRWMRLSADVQKSNGRAVMLYGTKQDITAEMAG